MNAIQAPIKPSHAQSAASKHTNPRAAAIADAVALCHPLVIRPSAAVDGDVIATAIDACATGSTAYITADGEGLLRMAPALFRASRLGLPIVMTIESTLASHDHVHAMALRDCGWVQLYPCDDQDAVDTHIQAFRIAETLSLPVMVCTDFFQEVGATDHLQVPSGAEIDAFLERSDSERRANPIAADETPAPHMEMRYLAHVKQGSALSTIRHVAAEFRARFGRRSGGFLATHQLYAAKLAVVGLGSTFEVITAAVDRLRRQGASVGAMALRSFRPFPAQDVSAALLHCERVVIVERAFAVGIGGIVSTDVRSALARLPVETHTVIAGLGEEMISSPALERMLYRAALGHLEELTFLDVNPTVAVGRPRNR